MNNPRSTSMECPQPIASCSQAKTLFTQKLRTVSGTYDDAAAEDEGLLIESSGTKLVKMEVEMLCDLLSQMMRSELEERNTINEVI